MAWPERNCTFHFVGNLCAPSVTTYHDATKIAADNALKSWQRKWDQDISGF